MIEVGDTLRNSREVSGVTLEEVSEDLDIPVILLEQIRTLDKQRLKERMGNLPENDMDRIDKALSVSFGLLDNI